MFLCCGKYQCLVRILSLHISFPGTVIGSNMMLGFYTIFDREKRKIGFARSKCSCKYIPLHVYTMHLCPCAVLDGPPLLLLHISILIDHSESSAKPYIEGPYPRGTCACIGCCLFAHVSIIFCVFLNLPRSSGLPLYTSTRHLGAVLIHMCWNSPAHGCDHFGCGTVLQMSFMPWT